ncbi:MAG: hypothetical protein M3Y60_10880 [Bacteroidota bacterium]|nr:hypothetical protein [Bacteroidota bacterium]
MSFISIHQYLSKLQVVFLALLIAPLLAFIVLHFLPEQNPPDSPVLQNVLIGAALLDGLLAVILFNKKIKSARKAQGLGAKLDKYFSITIVRYSFLSSSGLILAVGFFLTHSNVFTVFYLVSLIFSILLRPTGPRVSNDLMLKGDEREMVYFRKDAL